MCKQKPIVGPSLSRAVPVSFADGKLTLEFLSEHEFHYKKVESNLDALKEIIGALLDREVVISCVKKNDAAVIPKEIGGGKNNRRTEKDDIVSREPVIKEILDLFDGEINGTWRD